MNIYTIGENILDEWHWVEPYVAKTIAGHPHGCPIESYLEDIRSGHTLVLVVEEGDDKSVTLLTRKPNALHVTASAGNGIDTWEAAGLQALDAIARGMGVAHITANIRKGWAKRLVRDHGWKEQTVFIVREV